MSAVPCRVCSVTPTRRHLNGYLCTAHAPVVPAPPVGTTLAEIRGLHGITPKSFTPPSSTVVDARAIASGKRRSSSTAARAARANLGAHR